MAPVITTTRLRLDSFTEADVPALADILSDPEVTKTIAANGSTPELCLAGAASRIAWHNSTWDSHGFGVWAVRDAAVGDRASPHGRLLGWCGFTVPEDGFPEVLYGLAQHAWGRGLAHEAARAAIEWLFANCEAKGVAAFVFGRLNPASIAVTRKLGMVRQGGMPVVQFIRGAALGRSVIDGEVWRVRTGHGRSADALLFEPPYKGGQISTLFDDPEAIEQAFRDAAAASPALRGLPPAEAERRVRDAFRLGRAEPWVDRFAVLRTAW